MVSGDINDTKQNKVTDCFINCLEEGIISEMTVGWLNHSHDKYESNTNDFRANFVKQIDLPTSDIS